MHKTKCLKISCPFLFPLTDSQHTSSSNSQWVTLGGTSVWAFSHPSEYKEDLSLNTAKHWVRKVFCLRKYRRLNGILRLSSWGRYCKSPPHPCGKTQMIMTRPMWDSRCIQRLTWAAYKPKANFQQYALCQHYDHYESLQKCKFWNNSIIHHHWSHEGKTGEIFQTRKKKSIANIWYALLQPFTEF